MRSLVDLRVLLRHGPHERRLPACPGDVHVGAFREKLRHDAFRADARRHHQRGLAREQGEVGVGLGLEQAADDGFVGVRAGGPQRRGAEVVRHVHLGARANQLVHHPEVVAIARPVQRGGTIAFGRVDVGALLEEPRQLVVIDGLRCLAERRAHLGVRGPAARNEQQGREDATRSKIRRISYTPLSVSIGNAPVLPPIFSTGTWSLSMSVTSRFAMVGSSL